MPYTLAPTTGSPIETKRNGLLWLGVMLTCFVVGPTHAANHTKPPERSEAYSLYDCRCALRVRTVLANDPALSHHNVSVSVRDNDVYLWGLLPSEELARQAMLLARQVPGVEKVHSRLHVVKPGHILYEFIAEPPRPPAPPPRPARPLTALASLTDAEAKPASAPLPSRTADHWEPIMPAIALGPPPPSNNSQPMAVLMKPRTFSANSGIEMAIDQLRWQDRRFRGIEPEVTDKIVYLRGTIQRWEDLFELARAVGKLPGVERVILDNIRTVNH